MMRAPLAPSGWPIAIAPPLTLVLAEVFNILRDWYNNRAGRDDPKAMDKVRTRREGDRRAEADRCAEEATLHYEQVDGR
jgi:hypothetical protein